MFTSLLLVFAIFCVYFGLRQVCADDAVQGQRMDQVLWKRKLADLLQASDTQLIKLLRQDGLLQDWTGKRCPRCDKGTLSKLQPNVDHGMPRHRCNRFGCQAYLNTHHLHPIFVDGRGASHTPLQTQSALLFLLQPSVAPCHPTHSCSQPQGHRRYGEAAESSSQGLGGREGAVNYLWKWQGLDRCGGR